MFWEPSPCLAVNRDVNSEHVSRCATAVPGVGFRSLQVQDFTHGSKVASVRAGYRQVIDVVAIVIENAFRPYNGRLSLRCDYFGLAPDSGRNLDRPGYCRIRTIGFGATNRQMSRFGGFLCSGGHWHTIGSMPCLVWAEWAKCTTQLTSSWHEI
jgi:hypothetical protein